MTLLALRALVARIPTLVWVVVATIVAALALYAFAIHRGRVEGRQQVVRAARADSIVHQRVRVTAATAATDRVVAVAKKATAIADSSRARLAITRAKLAAVADSAPAIQLPVYREHVDSLEQVVLRDSTALAVYGALPGTVVVERGERVTLDTLQEHAKSDKPPDSDDGVGAKDVAAGVGAVVIVVELVRFLAHLIGR